MSCHPALKFASVKYDAAAINQLLDSTKMDYLTIQYNSSNGDSYKNSFTLISYARDSSGGFIGGAYNLNAAEERTPKTFKSKMILGTLSVARDSIIAVLTSKTTGKRLIDFGYLLFTPKLDKDYHYIYYDITVAGNILQGMAFSSYAARPCPPATNCIGHPKK